LSPAKELAFYFLYDGIFISVSIATVALSCSSFKDELFCSAFTFHLLLEQKKRLIPFFG
jgi:hypothetical protein